MVFSPRRTSSRSACSWVRFSGSRWTALVRASCSLPSSTMVSRTLAPPLRSAAANSRAGSDRWTTSWPCPYRTAGMRPARRVRRALPLPNSVRVSASRRKSATVCAPQQVDRVCWPAHERGTPGGLPPWSARRSRRTDTPSPSPGNTVRVPERDTAPSPGLSVPKAERGCPAFGTESCTVPPSGSPQGPPRPDGKQPSEAVRRRGPEGFPEAGREGLRAGRDGNWRRCRPVGRRSMRPRRRGS